MKLYCTSYWVYTVKDFIGYLFSLYYYCFRCFEVGKAKSATQSVLMKLWMGYSWKIFKLFTLPLKIHYPSPYRLPPLFVFFHYSVCSVISDCNHYFLDKSTFTHTVSQEYIIAIENTYLNRVFWNQKFLFFHKKNFNL